MPAFDNWMHQPKLLHQRKNSHHHFFPAKLISYYSHILQGLNQLRQPLLMQLQAQTTRKLQGLKRQIQIQTHQTDLLKILAKRSDVKLLQTIGGLTESMILTSWLKKHPKICSFIVSDSFRILAMHFFAESIVWPTEFKVQNSEIRQNKFQ